MVSNLVHSEIVHSKYRWECIKISNGAGWKGVQSGQAAALLCSFLVVPLPPNLLHCGVCIPISGRQEQYE